MFGNKQQKELVDIALILMIANPKSPAHNMESETQGFTEMDFCCRRVCVPGENMPLYWLEINLVVFICKSL